jgi:hypothetical protein
MIRKLIERLRRLKKRLGQNIIKLDLGGVDKGKDGWKTVNLEPGVDIQKDILELDAYCEDGSVDIFRMGHTYEHIPLPYLESFIKKLLKKLKKGGRLIIIQTDIKETLKLYCEGKLDFYSLRDVVFTSINRQINSYKTTGRIGLLSHKFMWGIEELKKELLYYGFSEVKSFDAGSWDFDFASVFPFQENEKYFGVKIPNLGIEAIK